MLFIQSNCSKASSGRRFETVVGRVVGNDRRSLSVPITPPNPRPLSGHSDTIHFKSGSDAPFVQSGWLQKFFNPVQRLGEILSTIDGFRWKTLLESPNFQVIGHVLNLSEQPIFVISEILRSRKWLPLKSGLQRIHFEKRIPRIAFQKGVRVQTPIISALLLSRGVYGLQPSYGRAIN